MTQLEEMKIEENEKIIDTVERILEPNNKVQSGHELNILTASQMLSRLPITLAQLKAGKKTKKLKNKIKQLLHSLNKSKKIHQKNL